jgi:uncharacterized membrane protein YhhN
MKDVMNMNMLKCLSILFFVAITCTDLYLISINQEKKRYLTKPFLIPGLVLLYFLFARQYNIFLLAALLFSFLGDCFLLFSEKKLFFQLGLFAFLTSHMLYIYTFSEKIPLSKIFSLWSLLLIIPYLIYAWYFFRYLRPYVGHYFFPVILYIVTIMGMSYSSLLRFWTIRGLLFWFPFIGSLFFIASDTLLAIRNFKYGKKKGWVIVMITYVLGQLLIILGFMN